MADPGGEVISGAEVSDWRIWVDSCPYSIRVRYTALLDAYEDVQKFQDRIQALEYTLDNVRDAVKEARAALPITGEKTQRVLLDELEEVLATNEDAPP